MTKTIEELHKVFFKTCDAYDNAVAKADDLSWKSECAAGAVCEAWAKREIAKTNWTNARNEANK